ncbi:coiled-coil domain-containing protein 66 isoform X1 [Gopherus evgoodei]|uniref:coiled-coil domain-containing protein 66 isoform X1 n=1 Tax=Gopherus evgoodei TaxID=1825980 RepID=UPI0011CF6111|nr:coiled-coil domain-containing protein 66 isoform X1 [Gopherus evgoodei]
MNLGDGLELETEIFDGKPRLILASYGKSKSTVKMGNKAKVLKHPLGTKQSGHVLKSTQNSCVKHEHILAKPRSGSRWSAIKGEKNCVTLSSSKDSSKESLNKNHALIIQKDNTTGMSDLKNPNKIAVKKPKQKFQKPHISGEDLKNNLVCLTQEQLEQILMTVKQGTKIESQAQEEKQEETSQNKNSDSSTAANQAPQEENIMGLLQKADEISSVPNENNYASSSKQTASEQTEQKVIKNSWKPADMFSTLGEREEDKILLDAKKSQWKKELDEQIALKKKLKESLERQMKYYHWEKTDGDGDGDKTHLEKLKPVNQANMTFPADMSIATEENHIFRTTLVTEAREVAPSVSSGPTAQSSSFSSPDLPAAIRTAFVLGEATPVEHPFSAMKREQQKKWLLDLDKQKEEAKLRKIEEKHKLSKAEEHERWAMHFDSLKNYPRANPQHPINGTYTKQPEILCLSPECQALTAAVHPFTPAALGHLMQSKVENVEKTVENTTSEQSQKASFLRSMTALLDPAQIEERDRRRQKQLEHQKAIMAQVEEKRRKKQLEEEQRKWEEQEEEHRLARERELMQKQFEEDMLKQKQKEEIMTLKTNELYQTMQRAQEQAQRLKQEQRIRELAQKGHDISKLQKNLEGSGGGGGVDKICESYHTGLSNVSHDHCSDEVSSKMHQDVKTVTSPRKDTAVQTDDFDTRAYIRTETCTEPVVESRTVDCTSPDISIEYKEKFNIKKCKKEMQYPDKNKISEKENNDSYTDLYNQFARKEKQTKPMEKYGKRPDWNINKPGKRYIPASERYPRRLQKQREEKKVRRQIELLQLVERNAPGKLCQKKEVSPERSPSPHQETNTKSKGHAVTKEEQSQKSHLNEERSESPPVPAVKNRLYQVQQRQINTSNFPVQNGNIGRERNTNTDMQQRKSSSPVIEPERPPSSHFIPYVRTNEIYYLDPDAPMTRPSTHDPQYRQFNDSCHTPRQIFSSDHVRDPLLNPNVVKNRDRQQAILKGLSELRQGLLQKQKELETGLIPTMNQEENFISPF